VSLAVFAVFCSELSASGLSLPAKIMGRRRCGGTKNSQPPCCFSAVLRTDMATRISLGLGELSQVIAYITIIQLRQ
jgi:hypothetical protein